MIISRVSRSAGGADRQFPLAAIMVGCVGFTIKSVALSAFYGHLRPNTTMDMSNDNLDITCYLKTFCGWSEGVRAIMRKYDLEYTEKDIISNPAFRWEMEQKSGQPLSPCVLVNGHMLADVSGDEVEQYLVESGLVEKNDTEADAPTDSSCANH